MAQPNNQFQEYWLPGFGLSRHIVISHLQYFLGPCSRVRPYTYQQREGYLIVGMPLTRGQIEDLQNMSREYERQETIRMSRSHDQAGTCINEPILVGRRNSPESGSSRSLW